MPHAARMVSTNELDLLAHAERHESVFTRRTAREFCLPDGVIDQRLRSHRWELVQPETIRVVGAPYTYETDVMAAVLSAQQQVGEANKRVAAASFGTCAHLRGLERCASDPQRDPVEITVVGRSLPLLWWDTVVHRTTVLPPVDVEIVGAIPCTTGARLVVDMATTSDQMDVFAIVDDAIGGRHTTQQRLHERAAALRPGRRHAALVRDVTAPGAAARFHSWLERLGDSTFRAHGLPEPRWNAPIYDAGRRVALADALFEAWRVVVELDGLRFHSEPGQVARDKARDRRLAIRGYLVLRFTYWELVERPAEVVAEIREALACRRAKAS
jgi:hypothetical protein